MKCKHCNGTGKVCGYFYEKTCGNKWEKVWGDSPCEECNGTGEIQQTNEEWLRNLPFNEFARVLYCMIINGERIRPDLAYIKKWLKEKHEC